MTAWERVAAGYVLPEALRWDGGALYFSDAAAGGVYVLDRGVVETVVPRRRGVGGLVVHAEGGVVISGRDLVHVRDAETRPVFRAEGALGLNDLITEPGGGVLVGSLRMDWRDPAAGAPGEVWRVAGGRPAEVLADGIEYPNGIGLGPDGRTLYVADFVGRCVHAFELGTSGRVGPRRLLAQVEGNPDGLAVDAEGGIWVATGPAGTLDRYSPGGSLLDRLRPPGTFVVTACFGGEDGRDLYVATADSTDHPQLGGSIFVTSSPVAGLPVVAATI